MSLETLCERASELGAAGGGLGRDGGMAEYMLVPDARLLVPLGELDPRDAAPLSDAALTPYHAIKLALHHSGSGNERRGHRRRRARSHGGADPARAEPARVIATDIDAAKLELARSVGADHMVASGEHAAAEILELSGGRGAALVLDCVGSDATLALDAQVVAKGGAVMVIGVAGGTLDYRFNTLPVRRQPHAPVLGLRDRARRGARAARSGHITAHAEHFPLERVTDAYDRMRNGTLLGRAVITPHG